MDEDEQEDLLIEVSDSDDSPEESDGYLDLGSRVITCPPFRHGFRERCCFKKRIEFLTSGFLCLLSATALLILLPLYIDSSSEVADVYPSLLVCAAASASLVFSCICVRARCRVFSFSSFKKQIVPPFPLWKIVQIGAIHGLGGMCVLYALDRQRVLCHLQDPLKGVILIFSMVYYFCFSRKIMGLQKIFCATTIIIGLFVSVDYALCDEFHCRGYDREKVGDDSGYWSRATHFLWGIAYIFGLALWCLHFSLLEGQIVALHLVNQLACPRQSPQLETISCIISSQGDDTGMNGSSSVQQAVPWNSNQPLLTSNEHQQLTCSSGKCDGSRDGERDDKLPSDIQGGSNSRTGKHNIQNSNHEQDIYPSTLNIMFWIYVVSFVTVLLFFWIGAIPSIGKNSSLSEFLNNTHVGILCHFHSQTSHNVSSSWLNTTDSESLMATPLLMCGHLAEHGWIFIASLLLFSASAYNFLILSQSSVFTVALISSALPLVNIFWSLFRLEHASGGFIQWWPNFTPELVCTLLGAPIVGTGLFLLSKAHLSNTTQKELCCTLRYHPRPAPA